MNLWTISNLGRFTPTLRRDVTFYAPLTESLDFMGIDPVTFTRPGGNVRIGRDGLLHNLGANVPRFDFDGENPRGLLLSTVSSEALQYSAHNALNDGNTLLWFEDDNPRFTPTDANPFTGSGVWGGAMNVHIKHVTKFRRQLSANEIQQAHQALTDLDVVILPPEPPFGTVVTGTFITEVPIGVRDGSNKVFTLTSDPNLESIVMVCFGTVLQLVTSAPQQMEFTLSGAGNRTITLGMAPVTMGAPFFSVYVVA